MDTVFKDSSKCEVRVENEENSVCLLLLARCLAALSVVSGVVKFDDLCFRCD